MPPDSLSEGWQPPTSLDLIKLAFRTPRDGIGDPAIDVGFMPTAPIGADFELSRERALGDLAVDGGARSWRERFSSGRYDPVLAWPRCLLLAVSDGS